MRISTHRAGPTFLLAAVCLLLLVLLLLPTAHRGLPSAVVGDFAHATEMSDVNSDEDGHANRKENGEKKSESSDHIHTAITARCVKCHGEKKPQGDLDLAALASSEKLRGQPDVLQRMIEALDSRDMPPESEPALDDAERAKLITVLKTLLREAVARQPHSNWPVRRLNRWQYNYSVRDLLQLNRDLFELPEKLMTRHDSYVRDALHRAAATPAGEVQLPAKLRVSSLT
ncbi:MAG: c-type cytochrome domain-containing protein, partial [Planctomycetota bacterium]